MDTVERPRPRGRPTSFSPELGQQIVELLRAGNYVECAAAYAGVARQTLYNWLRRGSRGRGKDDLSQQLREFAAAVDRAQAEAQVGLIAIITVAAATNWKAAAWRLERMHPEHWRRGAATDRTLAQPVQHMPIREIIVELPQRVKEQPPAATQLTANG